MTKWKFDKTVKGNWTFFKAAMLESDLGFITVFIYAIWVIITF